MINQDNNGLEYDPWSEEEEVVEEVVLDKKPKKEKKVEYPMWPGMENAELGVKYRNARGNIIQRGSSNG